MIEANNMVSNTKWNAKEQWEHNLDTLIPYDH